MDGDCTGFYCPRRCDGVFPATPRQRPGGFLMRQVRTQLSLHAAVAARGQYMIKLDRDTFSLGSQIIMIKTNIQTFIRPYNQKK